MKDKLLRDKDFFTEQPFWDALSREEQGIVRSETKELSDMLGRAAQLRIEMGGALTKLQAVLEPRREFKKYLRTLRVSERTAYRLIGVHKVVRQKLSDHVIRLLAARGMDVAGYSVKNPFGAYSEALKRLPPPSDEALLPDWADKLEEEKKKHPVKRSKKPQEPDYPLKTAYQKCSNQFKPVPAGKHRTNLALRLIGMLMWEFGLPAQTVRPEAPPEDFKPRGPGRPKVRK